MTTFVAVYRGHTISDSRLIALSADPGLVADVTSRILESQDRSSDDPAVAKVDQGRREALCLIKREAEVVSKQT